jgi:hypothetical protein
MQKRLCEFAGRYPMNGAVGDERAVLSKDEDTV